LKILVADDNVVIRRMVAETVRRWGYEIVLAEDGDRAWAALQSDGAPQLAILDWEMPGLTGIDICRRLRVQLSERYVYVIILTARDTLDDLAQCVEAGADDYLTKPLDAPRLKMSVTTGIRMLNLQTNLMESANKHRMAEEELGKLRNREVQSGARIQQTLLLEPPPSEIEGAQIAAITSPSQMIDGDFYDFFVYDNNKFDVLVGDVMGKGISGALIGAAVKSHVPRALSKLIYANHGELPEPETIVDAVHQEVTKELIDLETFVTLCYTRFDREKMTVKIVDCGHMATIHWKRKTDTTSFLRGENFPLGFSEIETYRQIEEPYDPGDIFFYYSDGVTEAQSRFGEMFGPERLSELIRRSGRIEPQKLVERVKAAVVAFTRSEQFADDLTCVAVKIDEAPTVAPIKRREASMPNKLNQLEHIRKFVTEMLDQAEGEVLSEEETYQLQLAVTEAASNVVRHALSDMPDEYITVSADLFEDGIIVRLSHFGKEFDPDTAPPPVFDGTREGGFGVYMIKQCVDDVQYMRSPDGRNTIRMVKRSSKR